MWLHGVLGQTTKARGQKILSFLMYINLKRTEGPCLQDETITGNFLKRPLGFRSFKDACCSMWRRPKEQGLRLDGGIDRGRLTQVQEQLKKRCQRATHSMRPHVCVCVCCTQAHLRVCSPEVIMENTCPPHELESEWCSAGLVWAYLLVWLPFWKRWSWLFWSTGAGGTQKNCCSKSEEEGILIVDW